MIKPGSSGHKFVQTKWEMLWEQLISKGITHSSLYRMLMTTQGKELHVNEGRREMQVNTNTNMLNGAYGNPEQKLDR